MKIFLKKPNCGVSFFFTLFLLFNIFFVSSEIPSQESHIRIASFNIRVFSNNSRDDKELSYISDILQKYDLVAVQEIRDEEVLKRTIVILKNRGKEYDYEISNKVGRGVKERYAFIYRKDKVKVLEQGKLYEDKGDKFIREPYYATFKAGNFDFTLITIHVLFGKSEDERRPEIKELATVYQKIQDADPNEQDVILLGDFNLSPTDEAFNLLKAISTMIFLIKPPAKTTISDRSLFDNFWFQQKYVQEYTGKCGIDKFDEIIFNNDDKLAKRIVSDHRPIWAEFNISLRDDD